MTLYKVVFVQRSEVWCGGLYQTRHQDAPLNPDELLVRDNLPLKDADAITRRKNRELDGKK